jgi:endoglucanase
MLSFLACNMSQRTCVMQVLGMNYFFYDVQRSGPLPENTRAPWRGDSLKKTGGGNLDGIYQGGYFDAGDHNKFMLPQAYATARLAWAVHKHAASLKKTYFDVCSA